MNKFKKISSKLIVFGLPIVLVGTLLIAYIVGTNKKDDSNVNAPVNGQVNKIKRKIYLKNSQNLLVPLTINIEPYEDRIEEIKFLISKLKNNIEVEEGYKGLLDLAYRSPQLQTVQAHCVYENDTFSYELGLHPQLVHKPAMENRGELRCVYAMFRLQNGGFGFEVMSKTAIEAHAKQYSKAYDTSYSPWKTDFESMAKKTVIKQVLKYAPMRTDYVHAVNVDDTTANEFNEVDFPENIIDSEYKEVA